MDRDIVAGRILRALADRALNQNAFFMTEVKNGPSMNVKTHLRLDAVMIDRSWTHPCVEGFEVKSCRQDFMTDSKWPSYLDYCNRFYFVCPEGVISKTDIPEHVGLIYFNGEKIRTVRKALYRTPEIPPDFFKYIIFSKLDPDRIPFYSTKQAFWKAWMEDKDAKLRDGRHIGIKVVNEMERLQKQILSMQSGQLQETSKEYERLIKVMGKHGIDRWGAAEGLDTILRESNNIKVVALLKQIQTDAYTAIAKLTRESEV